MKEREDKIREARQRQPMAELERKAWKAKERARLWTQEELDLAAARAQDMIRYFAHARTFQ